MGYAIAKGIVDKKVFLANDLLFLEKSPERIKHLSHSRFKAIKDITDLKRVKFKSVLIAVKPKDISVLLNDLNEYIDDDTLLLSIAAGVKVKKIESSLRKRKIPIGRVMPNTPCQIGKGINVLTFNKYVSKSQKQFTKKIFSSIGKTLELKEEKFDIVTALSGSGPAYFCYLIESLIKSGKKCGLDENTALLLSLQTGLGTLEMLNTLKDLSPRKLREMVTSPNGTTHSAITTFEKNDFENIVYKAIKAANDRSIQLGKG